MRYVVAITVALSLVSVLGVSPRVAHVQTPPSFGDWCKLELRGQTRNRHVYGTVANECHGCPWPVGHTGPFGNWGVSSWMGGIVDADQYRGWVLYDTRCNRSIDDPEWNSCTTSFPAPNSAYYNHPNGAWTSQFSPLPTTFGWTFDWFSTTEEEGCEILDGTYYQLGAFLHVYELDYPDSSDFITSISAPAQNVVLSCDREGCSAATTPWIGTSSNAVTSSDVRFLVDGGCHWQDGKGC